MKKIILFLLIIALLIRLPGLDIALYGDEVRLMNVMEIKYPYYVDTQYHSHPPLPMVIFKVIGDLFDFSTQSMRLFPLIFTLGTIIVSFLLAKEIYNRKVAFMTAILMTFSFHMILASLQISYDSFFMFIFALTFYSYVIFNKTKSKLWLLLTGLCVGIAILTKFEGIILLGILFITELQYKKNLFQSVKNIAFVAVIAIVLFLFFPLYAYLTDFSIFTGAIRGSSMFINIDTGEFPTGTSLIIQFLWTTPLIVIPFLFSLFKIKKKDHLLINWALFIMIINIFIVRWGDYTRYSMILLPPLFILAAKELSCLNFKRNHMLLGIISFFTAFVLFFTLNLLDMSYYTQSFSNYAEAIGSLNLNFFFPYAISSGSWFGVNFLSILLLSFFTVLFVIIFLVSKRIRRDTKFILIIFIGIAFAYNIFLAEEYLFHLSQPDPNQVIYKMTSYVKENGIPLPIYATNKAILYYLDEDKQKLELTGLFRIDDENYIEFSKNIEQEGGTILFLDFAPYISKEDIDSIKGCRVIKSFESNKRNIGFIYDCNN